MDLKYAYGRPKLSAKTGRQCNSAKSGENMNSFYRIKERF